MERMGRKQHRQGHVLIAATLLPWFVTACSQGDTKDVEGMNIGSVESALHEGDVNISSLSGSQNESAIAVNPANPSNLVAVANNNVNLKQLAVWYSDDGGKPGTPTSSIPQ